MSAQAGEVTNEVHFETVRMAWTADGLRARLKQARDFMTEHATKLTRMLSNRGPDPDSAYADPDLDRLVRMTAREAARAAIEIGTYNEGGSNNNPDKQSWQNRILGIVGLLVVSGIGTVIYQLADLRAQVVTRATIDQMSEVKVEVAAIAATQKTSLEATNERLQTNERRIETLERKVFQ